MLFHLQQSAEAGPRYSKAMYMMQCQMYINNCTLEEEYIVKVFEAGLDTHHASEKPRPTHQYSAAGLTGLDGLTIQCCCENHAHVSKVKYKRPCVA